MSTADVRTDNPVSKMLATHHLAGFSSTNFGKALFWSVADIFCLVFATDTLGMEPAVAGAIILVTLVWDAVSDPLAGWLVDRFPILNRQYGYIIRLAAPIGAVSLAMTFTAQFFTAPLQTVVFVMSLLVFRTAFTLVDIPDSALFSRIARSKQQRLFAASTRKLMATLAAVGISAGSGWVFAETAPYSEGIRMLALACVTGPLATTAMIYGTFCVRNWDVTSQTAVHNERPSVISIVRQRPVFGLSVHIFLSSLGMALFMASLVYYAKFVLGEDAWFATAMSIFLVSQAIGVILWSGVASLTGVRLALLLSALLAAVAILVFLSSGLLAVLLASCGAVGLAAGGLNTLRWALAPAVIDQAALMLGRRNEAVIMAVFSLSIKSAIGLSSLTVGAILSLCAYEPGLIADETQSGLFRACVAGAAVTAILTAIIPLRTRYLVPECAET